MDHLLMVHNMYFPLEGLLPFKSEHGLLQVRLTLRLADLLRLRAWFFWFVLFFHSELALFPRNKGQSTST